MNLKALSPIACVLCLTASSVAEEPVRLREVASAGSQYHVSTRVEINGSLSLPADKDKQAPKPLTIKGESSIDYDERILSVATDRQVEKTLRIYSRIDFQRKVGEQEQQSTIRPAVRRLVVLRNNNVEVPFSPDGPLMWHEIDLVRTDVFTPALVGMLPDRAVKIGDRWTAATPAIQELTDMEKINEGKIECRLEEIITTEKDKSRRARISFSGTVGGTNEDGPNRQQLDGFFYFDLDQDYISYITLDGTSSMLNKQGDVMGTIKGRFVLTRLPLRQSRDLSDDALKGLAVEPTDELTRMLFEDTDLGVRFLYPRRWRIAHADGNRIDLDGADGNGLRLVVEPLRNLPTAAQFLDDTRRWLNDQKAKILRTEQPRRLQTPPDELESFALEAEIKDQQLRLDYYVARQKSGGATLSARLLPTKQLGDVQKEVEGIARSLVILKEIKERKPEK